jgi:penicillin-binding protein 2
MFKYESEDLHIPHDILDIVHAGMFDVVNTPGGTAGNAKLPGIAIAGKTGTAQAGVGRKDHSWFICYAPFDHPKIAMCVLVENSGFGSQFAAPIARKLVHYYFTREKEAGDDLHDAPSSPFDGNGLPSVASPHDSSVRHASAPAAATAPKKHHG